MRELNLPRTDLEIREVVAEASRALARLDADRLEELALACQALNRDRGPLELQSDGGGKSGALARQAREAAGDMRAFRRVRDATRANLTVMRRLRRLEPGWEPGTTRMRRRWRGWRPRRS
jgi:hypothetical protein